MNTLFLLADAAVTNKFELSRIQNDYDWWIYGGVLLLILAPLLWIYRRDAIELPWILRFGLPLQRTAVLVGLLFVWLQPHWRSEREEHVDSRALLLVDTSLSMGKTDPDTPGGRTGKSRLQQVAAALDDTDFVARLRKKHQVSVIPFNSVVEQQQRVTLPKEGSEKGREGEGEKGSTREFSKPPLPLSPSAPSWRKHLALGGNDTRLGDALAQIVAEGRNTPVSGVVVISDGGQNAGATPEAAEELARESHIPIYTIGVGSEKKPTSVRVVEFNVPPRVFPGERFSVEGSVEGQGMRGGRVTVELLSREGTAADDPLRRGQGNKIDSCEVTLAGDGEVVPVKFDLPPLELGAHVLCMRIKSGSAAGGAPSGSPLFAEDKVVVDAHKMRVLLVAGGPMRDYQFLRTMLFRDKSIDVDVLLQSGQPGISQEATNLLTEFPTSKPQMAEYDCVVAFDPDWQLLSADQVDLLYDWVDQDHGGLIVVAGPVNAGRPDGWVQNAELAKIRKLYPVEFSTGLSSKNNVMYGSDEPARLEFTREGQQAPYLWLGDSAVASQVTWSQFGGVFGFCPVRDKKAGATVLARFGDSRTAVDGALPVYMAVHRFSASPVVYLGSAETWRLRRLNPSWFEMLWTKLIRYAAQEHLRRQSARGSLVVDNSRYVVGSTVEVRAELKNSELRALVVPGVALVVTRDGKDQQTMTMPADPSKPGRFLLDLPVLQQGDYTLRIDVPQSKESLTRTFHGVVPKLEDENPQRNAALLQEIAKKTDGAYYPDVAVAFSDTATASLVDLLKDVSHTDKIPLAPKPEDDEAVLKWMLIALCSVLCLEWLVRHLAKLA